MSISEEQLRSALKRAGFSNITVDKSPPHVSIMEKIGRAEYVGCSFVTALKDSV